YSWNTGSSSAAITGLTAGTYTVTVTDDNACEDIETVTITEPTALVASAVVDENASCNGSADGEATASGSGGTSPYSYSWNTGGTSANITGLTAGTYSVTVTDDNGCSDSASVTITEPNTLVASTDVYNDYDCWYSDSARVAGSATGGTMPYTYSWPTGAFPSGNDSVLYLGVDGTFILTITDDNGCSDTASFTLTHPDSIEIAFTTDSALCATASNGSVTATVTGGTGSISYLWPNGSDSTSNSSTGYSTGTYYMEFRDGNGCWQFDSFTIVAPDTLDLAITITDVNCNGGSDGAISTTVLGGTTPYTYAWNTGSSATGLTGLTAGTYTITVTDDNGCDTALAAVVQEPGTILNTFSSIAISCNGATDGSLIASGSGGTSPFSYSWSSGSSSDTASNLGAGTYTVTITDSNGCSNIFSSALTEPTLLVASIVLEDSTGCAGDSSGMAIAGAAGGTSPYSYAWPAGLTASNDTLFNVPAGTYIVTVTDDNGCVDTATAAIFGPDSIFLSIDSFVNVTCVGGNDGYASVLATGGSSPFSYLWPNGSTTSSVSNLTAGEHCVTVTDQNGCSDSACVTLIEMNPLPLVDLGNDTAICDTGYMLDAGFASAYQWNTGEITQTISASATGTYTVTVTDINGCQNFDEANIVINALLAFDVEVDSADCGTANGAALVTNIQGGGNYQINWSTGQIGGVSAINLAWGNYTVTVTDQNGCFGADDFFVFDNSDMTTSTYSEDASCNGTSDGLAAVIITSGGASPFDFDWSNGGSTDTISNIVAGTYYVTIEDDSGCHAIDTVDVGEPDAIIITTAALNADCGDSNGYAAIASITPPAAYTYAWNDPSTQITDTAYSVPAGLYTVTTTAPNGCTETALTIVNNVNGPALSMSAVNAFCENLGTGMAVVTASGTSPFSYEWSDPNAQTNDTASLLVNDTYFATVTDSNGCITIDSISVGFDNPAPLMSLSNDTVACADSVDLSPGLGFTTYSWSTGSGAPFITVTAGGTYGVTVSDGIGCVNSDSVEVILHTPITYSSVISNSNCTSPTGSVAITVLTGNGAYEYDWSTGDTTSTIINVFAGNYGLTISDSAGCEINDTLIVNWINAPGLLVTFDNASCNGLADANAAAIVNGGTYPYSYNWSTGGTDSTETGLGAGVYEITVTDDSGCVVTDLFVVDEPLPMNFQFLTNSPACGENDGNILVNVFNSQGPIVTYLWDDPNAITLPYADSLFAGYYTVTVTDSAGCLDSGSVALSNDGAPVLSMNSVDNNCSNETGGVAYVIAVGDDPFNFAWNDPMGQTNDTAFSLGVGTYAVSVTDTNGCIAIGQTSVGYFFDSPTVELGADIAACDGDEVIVTPGSGYTTYFWSNGTFSNSITVTSTGTYDVTITNSVGCSATDSVGVEFFAPPVINIGNDTVVCLDDTASGVTLDAGAGFNNYVWSTSDTSQTLTVNQSGYYQVTVSQFAGCEGSDGVIVVFDTCVNVTVEELRSGSAPGIILFPNPNRGQFVLKTTGLESGMYDVNLMNVNGQSVLRENVRIESGIDTRNSYDLGTTARGVYILTITGEGLRFDQRVIIQ
ncbi:MAG: T9SS type A sorting domain-containing protein, partial [Flavobacteriales bacterium]|nr:T9SS type A sorting domain-containing protein [Flavobacteriales bacterium]MBT4931782.1 T9SS type A sorting domain-containing protein [Flavobacteriales bacterium]MBT6132844.1 T9SS type A sorting domain-containing protein [Flavobacteriales bacterium]MBT6382663.1 T9SS type A sorting domain-containing protein [Flavobacteriales bacterium]MBT6917349.1 T9SS type A sorting domain-containing protein [Flavobacteriales bacterium]